MSSRELGKITRVTFGDNDGRSVAQIDLKFAGSGQALQWCTDADMVGKIKLLFLNLLGVETAAEMIGLSCYALRPSDSWGEMIVGLESMGGRRLVRSSVFPGQGSELDLKRWQLNSSIRGARDQIDRCEAALSRIEEGHVEWESR